MSVLCLCVVLRASKLVCVAATCLCYCGWYAVYLLYWYESTNSDAADASAV
jgi:hypothetical protein